MKKKSIISLWFLTIVFSCFAETYYLIDDANTGKSGTTAFKDAAFWEDADGNRGESGFALDSSADYVMSGILRQGNNSEYAVFGGASLRIGDSTSSADTRLLQYYSPTTFRKLYLTRGYYIANIGFSRNYDLYGDIEVDSPEGTDFTIAVSYTNSSLTLHGTLSADKSVSLVLGNKSPAYKTETHTNKYFLESDDVKNSFVLDTDLSGFYGTIKLARTTEQQLVATPSLWEIKAVIPRNAEMPGSMVVPSYNILSIGDSTTFKIGNLSLSGGSMLQYGFEEGLGTVVVTNSFVRSGVISVDLSVDILSFAGRTHVLLTVPNTEDNYFEADDFKLVQNWDVPQSLFVVLDEDAGVRKLVLDTTGWMPSQFVTLSVSDKNTKEYKDSVAKSKDSALTNAVQWSNNSIPTENFDYAVLPGTAPNWNTSFALRTRSDIVSDTFDGRSLTMAKNCILYVMTANMCFNDLRLLDGSVVSCPNTGSATIRGNIHAPCGSVRFRQYVRRDLDISAKVTGSAELALEGWDNTGSATGYYSFSGADMTNFYGTIRVTEHPSNPCPDYKSSGTNQTLNLSSYVGELQLGGKLDTFDPKALTIERCGTLALIEGNTLNITTNCNRGIYINGDGRIKVQSAWHKLNITTRLTVNGTLVKDGYGPLVLGGECVAEGENPMLDIWSSNVVVTSAMAVNGLSVKFGENARLELKVNPEDELLGNYGMIMGNTATPFVLDDGLSAVPFVLDCSGMERPEEAVDIALLTVASEVADNVESMLPSFASPFPRMEANLVRRDNGDGTATFVLRLTPKGFVMVLR